MADLHSILNHVPPLLLVICRIGGLAVYGPVFGSSVIPARVRVFLAFLIGLATYPLLSSQYFTGLDLKLDIWSLAPLAATELLIGVIVGFVASLPLLALETGGLIMGQQMGLGFARFYNPAIDDEADILGQLLFFMALGAFLIAGGHEWMLLAILNSFDHISIGGLTPEATILGLVTGVLLASLELALRVAAPMLALVFLETVAMGFLAKTVPQLNVLSLGFPIRILLGFAAVAAGLTVIHDVTMNSVDDMCNSVMRWIEQFDLSGGEK